LQSLTVQNKHLKQRQAALHATLDMEQQIQAAAATKQPSLPGSGPSAAASWHSGDEVAGDDRLSFTLGASDSGSDEEAASGSEVEVTVGRLLAQLSASTAPRSSGPGQAAGTGKQQQEAKADAGPGSRQQAAASAARGGSSSQASGSDWFFAASLHQHVSWYKQQVTCLSEHLGVLDAIPPRLSRTLEDYQRHEEVTDAIEAVLAGIVSGGECSLVAFIVLCVSWLCPLSSVYTLASWLPGWLITHHPHDRDVLCQFFDLSLQ
jgi:hypothetical protein